MKAIQIECRKVVISFHRSLYSRLSAGRSKVYCGKFLIILFLITFGHLARRRVSSVVEHSSANPKVPGSIPGPVFTGSWIMMRHVSCILLLEWSTTSKRLRVYMISVPYALKYSRFLCEKRRGQPGNSSLSHNNSW